MQLDDLVADGEAEPIPLYSASTFETLEQPKDTLTLIRFETDAVVGDRDLEIRINVTCDPAEVDPLIRWHTGRNP